jgi:hypothetical protein
VIVITIAKVSLHSNMLSKTIRLCKLNKVQITQRCIRLSASNLTKNPDNVSFNSISDAYGYKSKYELFRGWFVFKLCSYTSLVNHLSQVKQRINFILIVFQINLVIYYFTYCSWSTIIRIYNAFNSLWTFCCWYR